MSSVDVIVPCYRYGHLLTECVHSALNQAGTDVRVLIIDDASPDNTADVANELVRNDTRVSFVRHTSNKGHIATYNEGIAWASADYLLLLSADDYLLPGALNRAVTLMERHPRVGFTFGNALVLSEQRITQTTDTLVCQNGERILEGPEFISLSGMENIVCTPTAVVRTDLQQKVGGYRTELPHTGDMEMWLRLAAHACVGFLAALQAVYRRHASNMSLSYTAQRWLPDLEQRKAALEYFYHGCGNIVPHSATLLEEQLYLLSRRAVGHASAAFNDGSPEAVEQLSRFAVQTCPRITRSFSWAKLKSKRAVGLRTWRALRPLADAIRRGATD
ncbi:MAG: glycosyl transferase [Acidobacteriaceae bacterium]|nr:glycosyl transferase [Acidobacteriaceae bacterium]